MHESVNLRDNLNSFFEASDVDKVANLKKYISENSEELLFNIFMKSDLKDKLTFLDLLNKLDRDGQLKYIFTEGLRTNSFDLFKSLVELGEYPARFLSEKEFNQMCLKASFLKYDFTKIKNFNQRKNKALTEMLVLYKEELNFANRPVPEFILTYLEKKEL